MNTQPTHYNGDLDNAIISYLNRGKGLSFIAKLLKRDKSSIRQRVVKLQKQGYTIKGSKRWCVTEKGRDVLRVGYSDTECEKDKNTTAWLHNDRCHDIKVLVEVLKKPANDNWLSGWKRKELRNNVFFTQRVSDIFTTYTGKSLIFQLPVIRAKSPEYAQAEVGEIVDILIREYEKKVEGLKLGDREVKATLISQSHAIPNDPIASWCKRQNLWYKDNIINIDASEKPELETVDKKEANIHLSRYVDHIEDVMLNDVPKVTQLTDALLKMQTQVYATNKQLGVLVDSQKVTVGQMSTLISKMTPPEEIRISAERPNYVG